mmetsp:Transcript_56054/g.87241  ORF Transcript_56054/g.87241 Transcript_56054/m.87241 type:complete len:90 (-) Transcript_56054:15-284(-)
MRRVIHAPAESPRGSLDRSGHHHHHQDRDHDITTTSARSNKFLIGLCGATLLVTEVVLGIFLLTKFFRVENQEMLDSLKRAGIDISTQS